MMAMEDMAIISLKNYDDALAAAKEKSGNSTAMTSAELAGRIRSIPGPKPEQEKTVDIVENGTVDIIPDDGSVLSKVIANVNVPTGGGDVNTEALPYTFKREDLAILEEEQYPLIVSMIKTGDLDVGQIPALIDVFWHLGIIPLTFGIFYYKSAVLNVGRSQITDLFAKIWEYHRATPEQGDRINVILTTLIQEFKVQGQYWLMTPAKRAEIDALYVELRDLLGAKVEFSYDYFMSEFNQIADGSASLIITDKAVPPSSSHGRGLWFDAKVGKPTMVTIGGA